MEQFPNILRQLLRAQGRTQVWLAGKVGVSERTITSWMKGESAPRGESLVEIARVLGVDLDTLAGDGDGAGSEIPIAGRAAAGPTTEADDGSQTVEVRVGPALLRIRVWAMPYTCTACTSTTSVAASRMQRSPASVHAGPSVRVA